MNNRKFQELEQKLSRLMDQLEELQKIYRNQTGKFWVSGQTPKSLKLCEDCCFAVNTGNVPASWCCCCEESLYFDEDVSDGCSEFADI